MPPPRLRRLRGRRSLLGPCKSVMASVGPLPGAGPGGPGRRDGPDGSLLRQLALLAVAAARSPSSRPSLNIRPSPFRLHAHGTRRCRGGDAARGARREAQRPGKPRGPWGGRVGGEREERRERRAGKGKEGGKKWGTRDEEGGRGGRVGVRFRIRFAHDFCASVSKPLYWNQTLGSGFRYSPQCIRQGFINASVKKLPAAPRPPPR